MNQSPMPAATPVTPQMILAARFLVIASVYASPCGEEPRGGGSILRDVIDIRLPGVARDRGVSAAEHRVKAQDVFESGPA